MTSKKEGKDYSKEPGKNPNPGREENITRGSERTTPKAGAQNPPGQSGGYGGARSETEFAGGSRVQTGQSGQNLGGRNVQSGETVSNVRQKGEPNVAGQRRGTEEE